MNTANPDQQTSGIKTEHRKTSSANRQRLSASAVKIHNHRTAVITGSGSQRTLSLNDACIHSPCVHSQSAGNNERVIHRPQGKCTRTVGIQGKVGKGLRNVNVESWTNINVSVNVVGALKVPPEMVRSAKVSSEVDAPSKVPAA